MSIGDRGLLVEGLTVAYNGVPAVRGISFEVKSGEAVGLIGPNGSGKSSTLLGGIGVRAPTLGALLPIASLAAGGAGWIPLAGAALAGGASAVAFAASAVVVATFLLLLSWAPANEPARRSQGRALLGASVLATSPGWIGWGREAAVPLAVSLVVWGVFVRIVAVWHITWSVNSLAHLFGYRNYETGEGSRNNWLVALLTVGEGWHNNHHEDPTSASLQHRWWEIDVSYYEIRLLGALGLAWDIVTPRHLRRHRNNWMVTSRRNPTPGSPRR